METESYAEGCLKDLSISRNNFSWGIKIPCNDRGEKLIGADGNWLGSISDSEKHVIYVWLDALFNYQSALHSVGELERYWENAEVTHLVGKDILRFHAVYWPAFLIAVEYGFDEIDKISLEEILSKNILPKTIFAHGWWTVDGKKMSKSVGNVLNAEKETRLLISEFGLEEDIAIDYLKYYLATEMSFGADGDYSKNRLKERINAELANNVGNLIQRVLSMIDRNLDGNLESMEVRLDQNARNLLNTETVGKFDFIGYRNLILDMSTKANNYMEQTAPWNLKKENRIGEMTAALYYEVQEIVKISILLQVFCPFVAGKILNHFNIANRKFEFFDSGSIPKQKLAKPVIFFPKLEKPQQI
jgi:methionyl-tRNA synthetase